MSTYASPEILKQAIVDTYHELLDYQRAKKAAASDYDKAVQRLPEHKQLEQAKATVRDLNEKLKAKILLSPELSELREDVKYQTDAVASAKGTLSGLLVRQATQSKNKSVDVGGEHPREVILMAVLGQEAPEQMPLFEE